MFFPVLGVISPAPFHNLHCLFWKSLDLCTVSSLLKIMVFNPISPGYGVLTSLMLLCLAYLGKMTEKISVLLPSKGYYFHDHLFVSRFVQILLVATSWKKTQLKTWVSKLINIKLNFPTDLDHFVDAKKNWIFPFSYYYMPWQRDALFEDSSLVMR